MTNMEEPLSPAEQEAVERLRAAYADASRIDWPFIPSDVTEQPARPRRHRRRRPPGPWTHRLLVVAVAAAILVVFFVPLPHLSLFKRLVTPTKPTVATSGSKTPPIGTQLAELKASDAIAGDGFGGGSVAIAGNSAVVGATGHGNGRAYVFTKTAAGWTQVAELKGSATLGACFGSAVAVSGTTVVVNDACYADNTGRVYVFTREATGWRLTAQLEGSDINPNDKFGYPVAISGDTLVAGAFQHESYAGRAYVFSQTASGWKQTAELRDPDGIVGDDFGISVGVSESTVVVGAYGDANGAGRAYVFSKAASAWKLTAELKGSDTAASDEFGTSVAISGATIVVGAQDARRTGRAYVFTKTATGWRQVAELKGSRSAGLFGYSAGVSGNTILVSAPVVGEEVSFPSTAPGQAYVYTKTAAGWTQVAELRGSGAARGDSFGYWVAISGADALVGEPSAVSQVGGRAFLFHV